jgi:ABC-type antimicrobial peptide transport system permease subunit
MMFQWTLKTLWVQRAATLASAGGVAGAFLLVILLEAIFLGESKQMLSFIENTAPDVWVMQDGVSNMHMATSFVWDWKVDEVAALPGVESVSSILYVNTAVNAGGRDWFAYVVGIEPDDSRAGPWAMAAGRAEPAPGEIILPQMFARATGISLGDQATIADTDFTIVGLSKGTFSMANSVAFVSAADLEDILNVGATVSYMLVDAEAGVSGEELTTRIEAEVEKVNALTQEEFIDSDFEMAMKMGVEIISFMTILGSALAAAIIAFTTFVQVSRRFHELAVAKAIGVSNFSVYVSVVFQSLTVTGIGYLIAILIAAGAMPVIAWLVPEVIFLVSATSLMRMAGIALCVAMLAAVVPARFVASVDPASAFEG